MTKKTLLAALAHVSDDTEKDLGAEDDEARCIASVETDAVYIPDNDWGGVVYTAAYGARASGMDPEDWDEALQQPRVVVLWPA